MTDQPADWPTADDLDGALLVVIVPAELTAGGHDAKMWTLGSYPPEHHAAMLRMLADRLDPPIAHDDRG